MVFGSLSGPVNGSNFQDSAVEAMATQATLATRAQYAGTYIECKLDGRTKVPRVIMCRRFDCSGGGADHKFEVQHVLEEGQLEISGRVKDFPDDYAESDSNHANSDEDDSDYEGDDTEKHPIGKGSKDNNAANGDEHKKTQSSSHVKASSGKTGGCKVKATPMKKQTSTAQSSKVKATAGKTAQSRIKSRAGKKSPFK